MKNSIWFVLFEGLKIYFSNIDKFILYMLFPVLGQVLGIALCFGLTLGLSDKIAAKADSISSAMLFILLLAIPGLLIFAKAFWDYVVAYVALNSMTEGAVTSGKVYDFKSHNEVATRRSFKYIGFLLILSVLMSLGTSIFFIIPGFVLWIYLILIFQIFTFEPDLSIWECYKKSFVLVKGDWGRTFSLMLILAFFSIFIITQGITVVFDYLNLTKSVCSIFDFIGKLLPLHTINHAFSYARLPYNITVEMVSNWIFVTILSCIVAGLTLPIRSICWSLWYKNLSDIKDTEQVKDTKRSKKITRKTKNEYRDE
jgi:membrane protein